MIYANEYGTVDLLSEQFLQSLKSDNGTIGVKLSGGADTALLLHLLAKEISERNLNFSIVPYTFNDKPDRFIVAQNIIHEVAKTFPKVKFEKHQYDEISLPYRKVFDKWALKLTRQYDIVFFTNGVNLPAPEEAITINKELAKFVGTREAPRNYDTQDLERIGIQDIPEYSPFKDVDKRFTAQLYEDEFLLETLFPLTRSCLGSAEVTDYHEKPCKICYWCEEKYWAFGQYDAVG